MQVGKLKTCLLLMCLPFSLVAFGQKQVFVAADINNFWNAYSKINATSDSAQRHNLLRELYLNKASEGLKSLIEVRNYTAQEFVAAITAWPAFWKSIKPATLNVRALYPAIEADINKLRQAYPELKPSTIYFSVGAFRTNGTIQKNKVLIGSEMSLADSTTVLDELPEWRKAFYKEYNPKANLALLCTHEYVHTQQKPLVENLLSSCLYEGVAEFVSCFATGKKSASPAIEYGKANQQRVVNLYVQDLFTMNNDYNWLWGENRNELKVRDLGYYIGYEICERYYQSSGDGKKAIRELIELDYTNEAEVERIVDAAGLLPKKLEVLYRDYENSRPTVTAITPFKNGDKSVKPGLTSITVTFSEPLNGYNTGIDFGPLGESYCPKITRNRTWSADGKSWTFEAELKPGQRYQFVLSNNFRKQNGVRMKSYLIDFTTADN
ncbi:hypothetical protein HNQ91_003971 [Filimonas zeae]|nr:DUF2268 domain-containing putative Zn-dependent protease [Filimonas zeae]MDR6340898.1 hypothetical protein [Filimonas zeae]